MAKRKSAPSALWSSLFVLLMVGVGYSGLVVVENADRMRALYQQAGEVQRENDRQLAEFSRLRLEVGALTSLPHIEEVARNDLDMEFPETVEKVLK